MYFKDVTEIAKYYGLKNQSRLLCEECAELIQAMSKYMRIVENGQKPSKTITLQEAKENIIEEMADVRIMMAQMEVLLDVPAYEVNVWENKKIERTLKIMKENDRTNINTAKKNGYGRKCNDEQKKWYGI